MKNKADILLLSQGIDGGVAVMCNLLARGLSEADLKVTVRYIGRPAVSKFVSLDQQNGLDSATITTGKVRTIFEVLGLLWSVVPIAVTIFKQSPDCIIFGGFIPAMLYAPLLRQFTKAKFIYWDHAPQNTFQGIKKLLFPMALRCIDRIVSISASTANATTQYFGVSKEAIIIIQNGLDSAPWLVVPPAPDFSVLRIIMPARIDLNQKDHITLIKAAAQLHSEGIAIEIMFVGSGLDKPKVMDAIQQASAQSYVRLIDHSDDVPALMASCNVLCLSTKFEGFGLVLVEGMFARRAVVAAKVAGCVDVIRDGENGFLFEGGSYIDCAKTLRALQANAHIQTIIDAAFRDANKKYTLNSMVANFKQVILQD